MTSDPLYDANANALREAFKETETDEQLRSRLAQRAQREGSEKRNYLRAKIQELFPYSVNVVLLTEINEAVPLGTVRVVLQTRGGL